ncbi:uncharacterized protein LOC117145997 isoform X1 [Drosophila mauritiana]|uniref:Uncharacterized protein LOC117145997 isoform X1 n=1 Tax=Drosophila mauritiana TaxID=7226 RepID=A0A6P8KKH2_DROMA|nr:uncharacterized protein LOC117145997 isoform X1 [Drosophila mauritiana]
MLRTISICVLIVFSGAIMAEGKPFLIKVFAPSGGYSSASYQNAVGASPVTSQLISSLISSKIQLLNSVLQTKSSSGGFRIGFNKSVNFFGPTSATSTTEKPVTHHTTEVNTDFTPDESSRTTQLFYSTTTESSVETPIPTIHPEPPASTTPVITIESTTSVTQPPTLTTAKSGYSYRTPTTLTH